MTHPFWTYSTQVLSFRLGGEETPDFCGGRDIETKRGQALRAAARPGVDQVVLLGLGQGELAADLADRSTNDRTFTAVELDPARARSIFAKGGLAWFCEEGPARLIVDTSPWAAGFLLRLAGELGSAPLVMLNPELSPAQRQAYQPLRRFLAGQSALARKPDPLARLRLTLGAIVHPDEPELAEFFDDVRDLADDLVLVWDADPKSSDRIEARYKSLRVPDKAINLFQPLDRNFAAQRNTMLAACPGQAVLSLDADERLSTGLRRALPALSSLAGYNGVYLPRLTFTPDGQRVLCGYGLWPDPILRLFRAIPGARYVRPVHERLEGLSGAMAIAPAGEILHLSHLLKSPQAWAQKLARFDAASGGVVKHRRTDDYPSLPLSFFENLLGRTPPETIWMIAGALDAII